MHRMSCIRDYGTATGTVVDSLGSQHSCHIYGVVYVCLLFTHDS